MLSEVIWLPQMKILIYLYAISVQVDHDAV